MNNSQRIMSYIKIKNIIITFIILIILVVVFTISKYGFVNINVSNLAGSNEKLTYELFGKTDKKIESNNTSSKNLVKRGTYQISVMGNGVSGFNVLNSKGFLQSVDANIDLKKENDRSFTGSNIKECIGYNKDILYSWQCNNSNGIFNHQPVRINYPSVPMPVEMDSSTTLNPKIKSFLSTNEGGFIFSKQGLEYDGIPSGSNYELININDVSDSVVLKGLSPSKDYSAIANKDGFIAFSTSGDELLYFNNRNSNPSVKNINFDNKHNLKLFSVEARNSDTLLVYNNNIEPDFTGKMYTSIDSVIDSEYFEEEEKGEVKEIKENESSTIVIVNNNSQNEFKLDYTVRQAKYCGKYLCILTGEELRVYEILNNSLELKYSFDEVDQIESLGDNLLLKNKIGIVVFNTETRNGYYSYTFGEYMFCGIKSLDINRYILCIQNSTNNKQALIIDTNKEDKDSIDKKLLALSKNEYIESVSIYRDNIYISPNAGSMEYDQALEMFNYNQKTLNETNKRIKEELVKIGIDTTRYSIFNPTE